MKITESYLRNLIKEELGNILKQNLSPIYESLKVNVTDKQAIKAFIKKNDADFIKWLADTKRPAIETYNKKPGNFEGKGGIVDLYLMFLQKQRRESETKGNN